MPISYTELSSYKKGENWHERQIKIIIDDFDPPYNKVVNVTDYTDKPEVFEKNLNIQTDMLIAEIKEIETDKKADVTSVLSAIAVDANERRESIISEIKAVK